MPSYSEITTICGYKSKFSAVYLAKKMLKAGIIEEDAAGTSHERNTADAFGFPESDPTH